MENKEYSVDVQKLYLELLLTDPETFVRVQNIFNPQNFTRQLRKTAKFIIDHVTNYNTLPTVEQVNSVTGSKLTKLEGVNASHYDWLLDEFEQFSRHKALERAILESADLLEKGDYGIVEKKIKDAVQISLTKDLGLDYWNDPKERLELIRQNNGQISTGWPTLDKKLYGGFKRGELDIFAGGSGAGKSLFLANLGINWALAQLNVLYLTFELSEELVSMRMDAMLTGVASRDIFKNIETIELKLKLMEKTAGRIQVKYMPSGKTPNDIRSYIKEYQIKTGIKFDVLLVDYLDLLMPNSARVSPDNLFIKDKYVSEELRNLATETNTILVTASQLNRCLALDTIVISNGQKIQIKDVQIGDWLESNEGPVQVYEKLPITKQSVYKIKTKSGKEIVCSAKHKFPTPDGLKTIATGLKPGDYLRSNINNINGNAGEQNDN